MKNKLLITAMGVAMAGGMGLANADVKLYGQLDVSVNATDSDVSSDKVGRKAGKIALDGEGYSDDVNMTSNTSAIGVKGSEDLGNGMSAIFKVEWDTDLANGGSFKGRDQYLGLATEGFGKIVFGTTSTAYKSPSKKIDAFYRTPLQSRAIGLQSNLHSGKGEQGQGRGTNMIRYDTPTWSGFSATGTLQLDSNGQVNDPEQDISNTTSQGNDDNPYSIGVQYKGYGFYGAATYISTNESNDAEAAQVLAKYTFGAFEVHGIYELDMGLITAQANNGIGQSSGNLGRRGNAKDDGADIWSLGGTFTIGNNLIGVDYGQRSDSNGVSGVDQSKQVNNATGYDNVQEYTVWRIAGYHKFSNRTRVYAGYALTDYDDKGEDSIFSLGMRHNF